MGLINLYSFAAIGALIAVLVHRTHVLISLLGLEGAILRIVLVTARIYGGRVSVGAFICIILLTFGACEARLGLALLVLITRVSGRDQVRGVAIIKCLKL